MISYYHKFDIHFQDPNSLPAPKPSFSTTTKNNVQAMLATPSSNINDSWFLDTSVTHYLAHNEETLSNLQPYQGKNAININNSKNLTISHVSSKFFHNLMNFFICKMHFMSVDFLCNNSWWKISEKWKEKHTDLTWFGRLPTSMGIGKKTFTISQIRVT